MNRAKRAAGAMAVALGLSLGLGGCSQRPTEMVRADANRLYFQGQYAEAQPLYQELVERRNANAKAHYELGRNLLALGRAGEAREQMILAHNLEPDNETYLTGLADAYLEAGDEEELFQLLRHEVEDQGGVKNYLRLGRYAQAMGRADEAERALLSAAEVDGGQSVEPQLALAEFYRSLGDDANETRRLRMALWFDRDNDEVKARLRELGHIPGPSFVLEPGGRE